MRSEEDKILRTPVVVILGGLKYEVEPLVIKESRVWRRNVVKMLSALPLYAQATTDNPSEFEAALSKLLVDMPDTVVDLFFEYAKGLDREEIEATATDSEMAKAFEQVVEIAFPLARSPFGTAQILAP